MTARDRDRNRNRRRGADTPAALSIQSKRAWRISWPVGAPNFRKCERTASRETSDDLMSQTAVAKVSII
jgi:hypothetical protein